MSAIISKRNIEAINLCHYRIENMGLSLLEEAVNAGSLISKVKADLPHGTFMDWVKENLKFSHKTATNYMRLYDLDEAGKLETVTNIGEAYKLITSPPKITTPSPAPAFSAPVTIEAEIVEPSSPVIADQPRDGPRDEPLTSQESARLAELEAIIEKGIRDNPEASEETNEPQADESQDAFAEIVALLPKLSVDQLIEIRRIITARWA